jgi:PHD/YefM family antitoxin component YafN of YafNO toxin-antitoxin module
VSEIFIPVEKAKADLATLLKDATQSKHHYILTDKETPVGILMSASQYHNLIGQTEAAKRR